MYTTPSLHARPATPASLAGLATLIPSGVDLLFNIGTHILENRLKKFSGEYASRNIYNNQTMLPNVRLIRKVRPMGTSTDTTVMSITMNADYTPGDRGFSFKVSEVYISQSKALVTSRCNYIDLLVEVGVSYFDGTEKKTESSKPITIPLIQVGTISGSSINPNNIYTDKFRADKPISEITIKVTEVNPCKVTAEKLLELNEKFGDEAKGTVKEIITIIIPSSSGEADASAH